MRQRLGTVQGVLISFSSGHTQTRVPAPRAALFRSSFLVMNHGTLRWGITLRRCQVAALVCLPGHADVPQPVRCALVVRWSTVKTLSLPGLERAKERGRDQRREPHVALVVQVVVVSQVKAQVARKVLAARVDHDQGVGALAARVRRVPANPARELVKLGDQLFAARRDKGRDGGCDVHDGVPGRASCRAR